jgi:hypothetical protein
MKGETSMKTNEEDTVKSLLNGKYYKVKKIVNSMAVLQSEDGQSKILTEVENLSLFYKKKEGIGA